MWQQALLTPHLRRPAMQHFCPHCQSKATCRTSRVVTATMKELYMQCHEIECGHTWKALLAVSHSIVPSHRPNPQVFLHVRPSKKPDKPDERQMTLVPPYRSG